MKTLLKSLAAAGFFLSLAAGITSAEDPNPFKWVLTSSLGAARVDFTATLLPSGLVLVTGGYGGSGELASTELYDPAQDTFSRASDMGHCRSEHTATLLPNGKVLVVGGQAGGSTLSDAEIYDPSAKTWTPTGSLHVARSYHTATLLTDGEVLVAGGTHWASPPVFAQGGPPGSALDVAELYDPATGKWTVTDSLHAARFVHTATLLANGDVLVTGGIGMRKGWPASPGEMKREWEDFPSMQRTSFGDTVNCAEIFDHKTKTWSVTGNLLCPRYHHTATLLGNGQVLVTGGQANENFWATSELYTVSSGTWTPTGNLQTARSGLSATLLPGGQVLAAGGANNSGALTSVELYNPSTGSWGSAAGLNTTHALQTATLLPDDRVLLVGGYYEPGSPTFVQGSAELYGPDKPAPQPLPNPVANNVPTTPEPSTQPASLPPPPPSPLTVAGSLVITTLCIVIITGCVVVLLAAWMAFTVVQRWCK